MPHLNKALRRILSALTLYLCLASLPASAQKTSEVLRQMSGSFESLVTRVTPSVVEIFVAGYGTPEDKDSAAYSRQRSQGSGVIVDPTGYIITNFHVVKGAQRVNVLITPPTGSEPQAPAALRVKGKMYSAKIVGVSKSADLAVLKVEASGLPALPISGYKHLRQGQLVLAFGSPEGLQNSVSMGLVSSVLRQLDPDGPMVFIQTDAAINPGNSGGPLVDVDGDLVGINSSIYTQSGGNEGIGFAIPGSIAQFAYEQIKQYGRVRRGSIGIDVQTVTPELATALSLPHAGGVIVADVYPGSSAESAGLKVSDVIESIDSIPVDSVPTYTMDLYLKAGGERISVAVLRGKEKLTLELPITEARQDAESLADLADFEKGAVPELGGIAVDLTPDLTRLLPQPRIDTGVVIVAVTADHRADEVGIQSGDIIHSLNGASIPDLKTLRAGLQKLNPGDPAVLQIERDGRLSFLTFEIE